MRIIRYLIPLISLLLFMALAISILSIRNESQENEIDSYKNLIINKDKEIKLWKDNEGYWRSKSEVSLITSRDAIKTLAMYEESFINLQKDFKSLKKDLKNLESSSFNSYYSNYNISTKTKDTVFIGDTTSYVYFDDSTKWNKSKGYFDIKNKKVNISIESKDSIVSIVTKERRFLRKPVYNFEQKSFNPNTKVLSSKFVFIKTKRKLF